MVSCEIILVGGADGLAKSMRLCANLTRTLFGGSMFASRITPGSPSFIGKFAWHPRARCTIVMGVGLHLPPEG